MLPSTINRIALLLDDAFSALGVAAPLDAIERMAITIHQAMDTGLRSYHTSGHVFNVCGSGSALQVLAGLFHDVIYAQVDGGFPGHTGDILFDYIDMYDGNTVIGTDISGDDLAAQICLRIFGFEPGQVLSPYAGMNEFLSAIVAVRMLENFLSPVELVQIAACIEGTIPFRSNNPFQALESRLRATCKSLNLALDDNEIEKIMRLAVVLSNCDLQGFAEPHPASFLADTWLLLQESNAILWSVGMYSIGAYRQALMKMEAFLGSLDPDTVFHRYAGTPDVDTFQKWTRLAHQNVTLSQDYLRAKLLTILIVEALALATGGDVPVSMLLGDIKAVGDEHPDTIEYHLPELPEKSDVDCDPILLSVLDEGRARDSAIDRRTSPLTSFVCQSFGTKRARQHLAMGKQMIAGDVTPEAFLASLDMDIMRAIANAMSEISITRREALLALIDRLPGLADNLPPV
nr:hypothetical protein [Anaerolineae bacterium]